jgi:hypothetical protein
MMSCVVGGDALERQEGRQRFIKCSVDCQRRQRRRGWARRWVEQMGACRGILLPTCVLELDLLRVLRGRQIRGEDEC